MTKAKDEMNNSPQEQMDNKSDSSSALSEIDNDIGVENLPNIKATHTLEDNFYKEYLIHKAKCIENGITDINEITKLFGVRLNLFI